MKDCSLRVVYRRGEDGQLYVFMYRGNLHIGTVKVDKFNCVEVFRGIENSSPVFLKCLPSEMERSQGFLVNSSADRSQNFLPSKSKVKFDFNTVRTRVIPILKGIEVKMYSCKDRTCSWMEKTTCCYYLKKLEKAGLIRRVKRSDFVDYELTAEG